MLACARKLRAGSTSPMCGDDVTPATWASRRRSPTTSRCGSRAESCTRDIVVLGCAATSGEALNAPYKTKGGPRDPFVHRSTDRVAVGRALIRSDGNYQPADARSPVPDANAVIYGRHQVDRGQETAPDESRR